MKKTLPKIESEAFDERSAGGIVYRIEDRKLEWLIIKTIKTNKYKGKNDWRFPKKEVYKFPKGHLKDNEFLKEAAMREVEEEGKVKAKVIYKLGSNNYVIWDKLNKKKLVKKVTFFLMEYLGESRLKFYDYEGVVGQEWLPYEEARKKLAYESEKILLDKAKKRLGDLVK